VANVVEQAKELRRIWGGFWSARVLLTANNFGIFEYLISPKTADEVAVILTTDRRSTERLLDALTGLGLLKKRGSRYKNTAISKRLLISKSPYYQGDIIRHADNLWKNWSGLDEVIRTGKPYHAAHGQDSFIRGMHNLAILKARKVVRAIGLKGVRNALDLGGGPGTYAMEIARKGITVTLFDRPETVEIAKDIIKKSRVKNISFLRGDLLYDDIGEGYDLIFISQVLHSCSEKEGSHVIEKCRKALNPGGRVVVQEFYLRENRAAPVQGALFSINMLVNTPAGRCYSPSEIKRWLSKAGLKKNKDKIMDDAVLVFGENIS
jgi:ubiquinone/menaquinone biosynthesis C-methylase UbiE